MPNTTSNPPLTIGVIADLHDGEDDPASPRRCRIGHILLKRVVRRMNGLVRPDVVLVLGDLLDDSDSPATEERLQVLRTLLDKLDAPYLAIPGNHDGDPELFYRVFRRPEPFEDIAGTRFLAFVDRQEPGYNASRSDTDVERIRMARAGYDGPLVALQHVCLFPSEQSVAPYNYTNATEVIAEMKATGVTLSVSGHHHPGAADVAADGVTFVTAPGICEAPFPFLEISVDDGKVQTRRHELAMPAALQLVDNHLHTELAYCSENMTVEQTVSLARQFGLAGITFTEHAGQLYFDRKPYWRNAWLEGGVEGAEAAHNRMGAYLELKRAHEDGFARFGLEVECDVRGRLVLKPGDQRHFDHLMGTIHALPGLTRETPPTPRDLDDFLFMVDAMGQRGVRVLAHPMRIFPRSGWETPTALFEPTAKLLREHKVAAEINFHTNLPPVAFVRCCLAHGVKFSLGSDSHNLAEIGDFAFHRALLREAGFDGDLRDVLMEP